MAAPAVEKLLREGPMLPAHASCLPYSSFLDVPVAKETLYWFQVRPSCVRDPWLGDIGLESSGRIQLAPQGKGSFLFLSPLGS